MTHRLRLTVPADHHVAFDLPAEITGEVEIIVRPLAETEDEIPSAERRNQALSLALKMQHAAPVITADLTAWIREGRE